MNHTLPYIFLNPHIKKTHIRNRAAHQQECQKNGLKIEKIMM